MVGKVLTHFFCRLPNTFFFTVLLTRKEMTPPHIISCLLSLQLIGPSGRVPPIIRQGPANQTVSRGAAAQLHCRVIGGLSIKIAWEKDGERLQGNSPRMTLMENGTLQITDIKVRICMEGLVLHDVSGIQWKVHEKGEFWKLLLKWKLTM